MGLDDGQDIQLAVNLIPGQVYDVSLVSILR